ncbi:MAG: hypothetical protein JWO49_234, partial [Arthrobacter sp.]|nr:hypothetical protein [Arthrobacter sp.]
ALGVDTAVETATVPGAAGGSRDAVRR